MEVRRSRRLQGLEPLEDHELVQDIQDIQDVVPPSFVADQPIHYLNQCLGVVGSFVAALTFTRVVAAAVSLPGYTLF